MTCERCEEYTEKGARYCPYCGSPLNGSAPYRDPYRRRRYGFIFIAGLVAAIQGLLIMFFEITAAWAMMGKVLDYMAGRSLTLYYITPHLEDLVTVGDVGVMAIYVLFTITVTACFALMIYQAYVRVRSKGGDLSALEDTAAYEVPVITGLFLGFELLGILIFRATGGDASGADGLDDGARSAFTLMFASVYEEILCRLLLLGLPCLIIALLLGRKDCPRWKYLFGGMKYERWMIVFIVFSAAMFGMAHLDNWGSWKFVPTFLFGLVEGYLFVKYGLHATIAMHFINDYLDSSRWAYDTFAIFVLGILAVGFCALPYLVRYGSRIYARIKEDIALLKGTEVKEDE